MLLKDVTAAGCNNVGLARIDESSPVLQGLHGPVEGRLADLELLDEDFDTRGPKLLVITCFAGHASLLCGRF
jgi:hypothetical protein